MSFPAVHVRGNDGQASNPPMDAIGLPCGPAADLQVRLDTLLKDHYSLHDRVVRLEEWVDVVSSPVLKRVFFWLRGWRWRTLGRWRGPDRTRWPGRADKWWMK
jgi:hypothetical protein